MTKQGRVPRKYLPHVLERHRLASSLLVLQLLMGIAISTLTGWLLLWAPNLPFRDVPYWSGTPVLFSAVIGLILVCSCRQEYPGMPTKYYVHGFKVFSILCSLFASVAAFCASGFALIHLVRLYKSNCQPANELNAICVCKAAAYALTYPDLNCPEVWNVLSVLLIGSSAANVIAGFLSAWYVILHWTSRTPRSYTKVATNDNRAIVVTNKL